MDVTELKKTTIVIDNKTYDNAQTPYKFEFTHVLDDVIRNVHKIRVDSIVMPAINQIEFADAESHSDPQAYATLVIEDYSVSLPFFFEERYFNFNPYYTYPVKLTPDHVVTYDTPIGSIGKLRIKVLDPDGAVLTSDRTKNGSKTFVLILTLFHDQRDPMSFLPMPVHLKRLHGHLVSSDVYMFDWTYTKNDFYLSEDPLVANPDPTYVFKMDFGQVETIRNVSHIKLLGLLVRPFVDASDTVIPYVVLKMPDLGIEWPVHFEYWHNAEDIIPLRVTQAHQQSVDPTRHVQHLAMEVHIPELVGNAVSLRVARQTDHFPRSDPTKQRKMFGLFALLHFTTMPRLDY